MKENTQVDVDVDIDVEPSILSVSGPEVTPTEWANVLWLSSMLAVTGIAVCLVFNYIL